MNHPNTTLYICEARCGLTHSKGNLAAKCGLLRLFFQLGGLLLTFFHLLL